MANRSRNSVLTIATILLIFTSAGKGAYQECSTTLRNTVVYERALDTVLGCPAEPNSTAWSFRPTSNAVTPYNVTYFNDFVNATLTNLYAYNQSGLIVRNATTTASGGLIPTAGIYIVQFANTTNRTAAKLVVIRSGPVCSCIELASGGVNISCNIIYADHPVGQINPIVNCTANGQLYTSGPPNKTLDFTNSLYVYDSTSTITINSTVPTAYDCQLTFAAPKPASPPYLATNAPDFSVNFTVCESPTTTALSTTTALLTTTATKPLTTTAMTSSTTNRLITTTSEVTISTQVFSTSTMTQLLSTSAQLNPSTTSAIDIGLLTTKIILSTILGLLLMTIAAICCSWCFLSICPPVLPFRRSTRYLAGELRMFQRRKWIPVRREILEPDYWDFPFYQQSFCKYPTPCENRLPSRCRCVQSCVTQPHPQQCSCGQQARMKAYYGP